MSYFYCDFRDPKKQQVSGLLASLLAQLSAKSDPCCNILSALYSKCDAGSWRPSDGELMDCLEDMLNLEAQPPIYIIIDGLDECPNDVGVVSPREQVLEQVVRLVALQFSDVRICVTSRPEVDIQAALTSLAPRVVSLHDEKGQSKDITDYIKRIVYSDRKMRRWKREDKETVIRTLSQNADGMQVVTTQPSHDGSHVIIQVPLGRLPTSSPTSLFSISYPPCFGRDAYDFGWDI